jgi:hypothetical protein
MVAKVSRNVYEVIELVEKEKSRADKIRVLKSHDTWALRDVLRGAYDDIVVWSLPPGSPPYEPAPEFSPPSSLFKQHLKFKYFVKGLVGDQLNPIKREKMFIDMLESVHPKDAELLVKMKDKKPLSAGVTKKLVQEAYPDLIKR